MVTICSSGQCYKVEIKRSRGISDCYCELLLPVFRTVGDVHR